MLQNTRLAKWFAELAEAGITKIRIGTKELAFFPMRVDYAFLAMLDRFNQYYPQVRLIFVLHFTHPDEFLERDSEGRFVKEASGEYRWLPEVLQSVSALSRRGNYVTMENQTPIIRAVNDDSDALRVLQSSLYAQGVNGHYFFQCRPIEGHKAFAVPLEETWAIYNRSQIGLSGVESHSRLVLSTERGKVEVCGVSGDGDDALVAFKLLRSVDRQNQGNVAIVKSNPEALWLDAYKDRVVFDPSSIIGGITSGAHSANHLSERSRTATETDHVPNHTRVKV